MTDPSDFSYDLPEGKTIGLSGIIDRMDLFEENDSVYIKIIDYKSSDHSISLSDVYEGLELQLLLYMKAASDEEQRKHPHKNVIPSAVFYYQIKDPVVSVEKPPGTEELARMIAKALRVKGLFCDEEAVLTALDKSLMEARAEGRTSSSVVIPASIRKDGSLSKTSSAVTREDFQVLGEFVEKKIKNLGGEIAGGAFPIYPFRKADGSSGCDYCPYHSVCGMDLKLPGFGFRKLLEEKDAGVILELMKQEL